MIFTIHLNKNFFAYTILAQNPVTTDRRLINYLDQQRYYNVCQKICYMAATVQFSQWLQFMCLDKLI